MGALTIAQVGIRQDDAGRFCLNDLHRAAGGESKHQPAFFMRRKETGDLIEALNSADPQSLPAQTVEGRSGGTFVAKELVYAYAMWISPAFHLQVIRAYDANVTQRAAPLAALEDPAALRTLLLGYAERQLQLEQQVHEQAPKVEALDRLAGAAGAMCLTDAAKALQMRRADLLQWMQEHAWIYRRPGTSWLPYQPRIQTGVLTLKVITIGDDLSYRNVGQVLVTAKGLARLGELLAKERTAA